MIQDVLFCYKMNMIRSIWHPYIDMAAIGTVFTVSLAVCERA